MEVRGVVGRVTVYDDFAHHPTAIETTLRGSALRGSAQRAHHRRAGAALQHHENGRASRPAWHRALATADLTWYFFLAARSGLGSEGAVASMGGRGRVSHADVEALVAGTGRGGANRRSHPGHEQRRLRRPARETVGRHSRHGLRGHRANGGPHTAIWRCSRSHRVVSGGPYCRCAYSRRATSTWWRNCMREARRASVWC